MKTLLVALMALAMTGCAGAKAVAKMNFTGEEECVRVNLDDKTAMDACLQSYKLATGCEVVQAFPMDDGTIGVIFACTAATKAEPAKKTVDQPDGSVLIIK